jgi:hypothetical protein
MPFLHEEKTIPADEYVDTHAPLCRVCNTRMWLGRVSTTVTATDRDSKREYECKRCGLSQIVMVREPL